MVSLKTSTGRAFAQCTCCRPFYKSIALDSFIVAHYSSYMGLRIALSSAKYENIRNSDASKYEYQCGNWDECYPHSEGMWSYMMDQGIPIGYSKYVGASKVFPTTGEHLRIDTGCGGHVDFFIDIRYFYPHIDPYGDMWGYNGEEGRERMDTFISSIVSADGWEFLAIGKEDGTYYPIAVNPPPIFRDYLESL